MLYLLLLNFSNFDVVFLLEILSEISFNGNLRPIINDDNFF